jgi:hypothetical protein
LDKGHFARISRDEWVRLPEILSGDIWKTCGIPLELMVFLTTEKEAANVPKIIPDIEF